MPPSALISAPRSADPRVAPAGERRTIAAAVLLGGSLRTTEFHAAIQRSPVDLPLQPGRTLLDAWCDGMAALAALWAQPIGLRILADHGAAEPRLDSTVAGMKVSVERDPSEWRGTGGVLRDISGHYPPEHLILVANASQILLRPLPSLVDDLDRLRADVAVLAHADGIPTTFMLVRAGCLAVLPDVGFVDMKEQAIPLMAARHRVVAVSVNEPAALGVRTGKSYLRALRQYHAGGGALESWQSAFQIVEEGAAVEPGARLHDSVVLRGGRVQSDAVVVRSVLCPGAVVRRGQVVVDRIVLADGRQVPTEEAP